MPDTTPTPPSLVIDDREPPKLRDLVANRCREQKIKPTEYRLPAGDFAFEGYGPDNEVLYIGVERKTWSDVINSLADNRMRSQTRKMAAEYDVRYLLIEGEAGVNDYGGFLHRTHNGTMVSPTPAFQSRQWTYAGVMGALETIRFGGDYRVLHAKHMAFTARTVASLAHWWSKPWEEHSSLQMVTPLPKGPMHPGRIQIQANFAPITRRRCVAADIPGFGWEKSKKVEERFRSIGEMALAETEDWLEIDGVGPRLAKNAIKYFGTEG